MLDERGDVDGAKRLYQKAIEAEDSVADAYCNLGIIAFGEEEFTEAVDFLTLSLRENPRHYQAHFNLANVYAEIGNTKLAQCHYQLAVKMKPDFSSAYFNLGLTLASLQKYSDAEQALRRYLELVDPQEQQPALDLIRTVQALSELQN